MPGLFRGRSNPLESVTAQELELHWEVLASTFGQDWLDEEGEHPLQLLWLRKDAQSTVELYTLAQAIAPFAQSHKDWLKHQRKQVLSANAGNRRGALFELIGLSFFMSEGQRVTPAVRSQAGFDGAVLLRGGGSVRLSIKSYGVSAHNETVNRRAARIEEAILHEARARGLHSVECFMDLPSRHPSPSDWNALEGEIPGLFDEYQSGSGLWQLAEVWMVGLRPLQEATRTLHRGSASYTLVLCVPNHANEQDNVRSKIEEACRNLTAARVAESESTKNMVMIRVPWTASISQCKEWGFAYLRENQDEPISAILFFQPSVTQSSDDGRFGLHGCFALAARPAYETWLGRQGAPMAMALPVGVVDDEPAKLLLRLGDATLSVEDRFIYQRGHHYETGLRDQRGKLTGNMSNPVSGIHVHSVLQPIPGAGEIVLSGKFPPDDQLFIV